MTLVPHRMILKLHSVYTLFLFLMMGLNMSTGIIYVVFCAFILTWILFDNHKKIIIKKKEDYIAGSFLLVWCYGLVRGIFLGNTPIYIIANFAGIICYSVYFILVSTKFSVKLIQKLMIVCGITVSCIALFRFLSFFVGINYSALSAILGEGMGISSTGQLRIYFSSQAVAYALLGLSFVAVVFYSKKLYEFYFHSLTYALFCFSLTIASLMFFSASKGFMLGCLTILGTISVVYPLKRFIQAKISTSLLWIALILLLGIYLLDSLEYLSVIEKMFDRSDNSNSIRYEQMNAILSDCTFLGKGLGAEISNCIRAEDAPYGFELTFLNVIHKFGIFSLIFFIGWIYMICISIKKIYNHQQIEKSVIVFSSMGYLCPAIGNPLLFHPALVILNTCSLYILRNLYYE